MKIWKRVLGAIILLAALLYSGDYFFLRLRMAFPKMGKGLDSVQMERLYAMPLKSGKLEYDFDPSQPELTVPCAHSLFPHMGYEPSGIYGGRATNPFLWL